MVRDAWLTLSFRDALLTDDTINEEADTKEFKFGYDKKKYINLCALRPFRTYIN